MFSEKAIYKLRSNQIIHCWGKTLIDENHHQIQDLMLNHQEKLIGSLSESMKTN